MAEIREFVPGEASREDWRRYHVFRRARQREWRPDDPPEPDHVAEALLKRGDPTMYQVAWQATAGDEIVGVLDVEAVRPESPEYETNRHLVWADAYVLVPHRRRGIGRAWIPTALALMDRFGATVLTAMAEDDAGNAFLRSLGAEPRIVDRRTRLDLRTVDWEMVARWVREGEERSPGASLEFLPERVPDAMLAEYAAARTELMNLMPWEDMDHGKIVATADKLRDGYARFAEVGSVVHTCVVRDAGGSIAGITDVMVNGYEPDRVHQEFTGVHPAARGRGIGRWMKAAMLQHVRRLHPEAAMVLTENAGSNRWMLAINDALGFRLHRLVTTYQVDRARLARLA